MSRITQLFGAAGFASAVAIVTHLPPLDDDMNTALTNVETSISDATGMDSNDTGLAILAGLGAMSILGLGMVVGASRRRIEDSIETGVDSNEIVLEEVAKLQAQISNMDLAVVALEGKVLKPLNIDLSAVEEAITKLKDTEMAAGDTLDVIRNIETEVDKVVASLAPRDFAGELAQQRKSYNDAYNKLVEKTEEAFEEYEGFTKQNAKIMAKLSELDATIKQSVLSGSTVDAAIPAAFLETIAEQLGEVEDEIGESGYFAQIVADASKYVHKASEYLLTNLEKRQQAQQANGVANGANPDTAPQQMHEDIDHNNPVLG